MMLEGDKVNFHFVTNLQPTNPEYAPWLVRIIEIVKEVAENEKLKEPPRVTPDPDKGEAQVNFVPKGDPQEFVWRFKRRLGDKYKEVRRPEKK
jgi:hypothetical protein